MINSVITMTVNLVWLIPNKKITKLLNHLIMLPDLHTVLNYFKKKTEGNNSYWSYYYNMFSQDLCLYMDVNTDGDGPESMRGERKNGD